MYTGSFLELADGSVRAADVAIRNANGDFIDFGSVTVVNFPATQNVAGTVNVGNFPATQNVVGVVSVLNFPATVNVAIVSGELATINIGNFPAVQTVLVSGAANAALSFKPSSNLNAGATLVLAANPNRKKFALYNALNKTLAVGYANSVTNSAYSMPIAALSYYESQPGGYTGDVYALTIGVASAGNVAITEFV